MKSAKDWRDTIKDLLNKITAIVTLTQTEDRELTVEDNTQIDEMNVELGNDGTDNEARTGCYASLYRAESIEKLIASKAPDGPTIANRKVDFTGGEKQKSIIPANANYSYNRLWAYDNREAAYRAGQFFAATLFRSESAAKWCQEHGIATSFRGAQTEGSNPAGGFVVPQETEQAIINLREEYGVARREARIVPMGADTKTIPRRTGGVTAYFGGEGADMTESDKSFGRIQLTAKKLYVLTKYSNELGEDAIIDIGQDITIECATAMAHKEDECCFMGDGTSTYGGMTGVMVKNAAGSINDAVSGNTAYSTLDFGDFESTIGKLPVYAQANAKWYLSKVAFYACMARLADASGGNTIDHTASGPNMLQFLGYPVVLTQVMNSVLTAQASTQVIAFGDLRQGVAFGSRRGLSVMLSEHAYFASDQIGIRCVERFDINYHEIGTSSTAGSVITLKTAAS